MLRRRQPLHVLDQHFKISYGFTWQDFHRELLVFHSLKLESHQLVAIFSDAHLLKPHLLLILCKLPGKVIILSLLLLLLNDLLDKQLLLLRNRLVFQQGGRRIVV